MAGFRGNAILKRLPPEHIYCRAAEIGVDEGTTSAWLLGFHRGLHLLMIDPWKEAAPGSAWRESGDRAALRPQAKHNKCKRLAEARTRPAAGRRLILQKTSLEASRQVQCNTLDLVFIDGEHTYEGVRQDIEIWRPKVRGGGWIGGHDYLRDGDFPGVQFAVDEMFEGQDIELDEDSTWWVHL